MKKEIIYSDDLFEEIAKKSRTVHKGLLDSHIRLLLSSYTVSEILSGRISHGVFYPSWEIGKQWLECNKKRPLTHLRLWQPRKSNIQEIRL